MREVGARDDDRGGSGASSLTGEFYYGVARDGYALCTNMWTIQGAETSGGCSDCQYTFEVDHTVATEECGSSGDFTWSISWPYNYGAYELVAVDYGGTWYPRGWLVAWDTSSAYWYALSYQDTYGYYYFTIGDYTLY